MKSKHPSYGLLKISRVESNKKTTLFGSSIGHQRTIELTIYQASEERSSNKSWYHAENRAKPIVEVEMSPIQFAEIITNMNYGEGHPVTIRNIGGSVVDRPDHDPIRKTFEKEFKSDITSITGNLAELKELGKELSESRGSIKVSDRERISGKINKICQDLKENLPFIYEQFNRQMDKTVSEARSEIDAFTTNMITQLGLEALDEKINQKKLANPIDFSG